MGVILFKLVLCVAFAVVCLNSVEANGEMNTAPSPQPSPAPPPNGGGPAPPPPDGSAPPAPPSLQYTEFNSNSAEASGVSTVNQNIGHDNVSGTSDGSSVGIMNSDNNQTGPTDDGSMARK